MMVCCVFVRVYWIGKLYRTKSGRDLPIFDRVNVLNLLKKNHKFLYFKHAFTPFTPTTKNALNRLGFTHDSKFK